MKINPTYISMGIAKLAFVGVLAWSIQKIIGGCFSSSEAFILGYFCYSIVSLLETVLSLRTTDKKEDVS